MAYHDDFDPRGDWNRDRYSREGTQQGPGDRFGTQSPQWVPYNDPYYTRGQDPYASRGGEQFINRNDPYFNRGESYFNRGDSYVNRNDPYFNRNDPYVSRGNDPYFSSGSDRYFSRGYADRNPYATGFRGGNGGTTREEWLGSSQFAGSQFGSQMDIGRGSRTGRGTHIGRGPKGYRRSDERIREDVSDRLTMHPDIDASDIEVRVANGIVTLTGVVEDRHEKRIAEDIAEFVTGVDDVQNDLKVRHGFLAALTGEKVKDGNDREVTRTTKRDANETTRNSNRTVGV